MRSSTLEASSLPAKRCSGDGYQKFMGLLDDCGMWRWGHEHHAVDSLNKLSNKCSTLGRLGISTSEDVEIAAWDVAMAIRIRNYAQGDAKDNKNTRIERGQPELLAKDSTHLRTSPNTMSIYYPSIIHLYLPKNHPHSSQHFIFVGGGVQYPGPASVASTG